MISWVLSGDAVWWLTDPAAGQEDSTPNDVTAVATDPGTTFQADPVPKQRRESFSDSAIHMKRKEKSSWFISNSFSSFSSFTGLRCSVPTWNFSGDEEEEICIADDDIADDERWSPDHVSPEENQREGLDPLGVTHMTEVIADNECAKVKRRPLSGSTCTTSTQDPSIPTSTPWANVLACDSDGAFVPSMLGRRRVPWPNRGVRTPYEEHYLDVEGRVSVIAVLDPVDTEDRFEKGTINHLNRFFADERWNDRETVIVENHCGNPCAWLDKAARKKVEDGWLLVSLRSKERLPCRLLYDIGVLMASGQYVAGVYQADTFDDLGSSSARKTTLHLRSELLPLAT